MKNLTIQTWFCVAVTLIAVHLLVMASLRPYGYNLSAMIRLSSDPATDAVVPEYFQKGMVVFDQGGGYDGEAYYYVAMDPFLTIGHYKDAYRQQRVVYPLVSRIIALNDVRLLPYGMYAANLIALGAGVYLFSLILRRFSMSPFWSLFYGLAPASIMTVQYDLPSPLCIALLIAAVYFYLEDNLAAAAAFLTLAFLTREDSVMVFVPLVLWELHTRRSFKRVAILAASLVPFFLWHYYIYVKLGSLPISGSSEVISLVPFSGIYGYVKTLAGAGGMEAGKAGANLIVFAYFTALLLILAARLVRTRHLFYYTAFAYALLSVFTVPSQWNNFNGLLRMFYGIFPFLVLSYGVEKDRTVGYGVWFIAALAILTVVRVLFISPVYHYRVL
ncbi:MAG: hypothetical protein HY894_02875 [Deltaproteobacteria bacterium]|nr:hypothetical protein [Deltaproteobacteria bacterium]